MRRSLPPLRVACLGGGGLMGDVRPYVRRFAGCFCRDSFHLLLFDFKTEACSLQRLCVTLNWVSLLPGNYSSVPLLSLQRSGFFLFFFHVMKN